MLNNYKKIGSVVTNLQSLEFALRLFLDETQGRPGVGNNKPLNLTKLTVGEWVPENNLTNYDTLKQLIQKTNAELQKRGLSERIDESLVQLRDAIAHGRVLSLYLEGPLHIVKFSKPDKSKVQVEMSIEVTPEWLSLQVRRTQDELLKVVKLGQLIGLKCFPKD